MTWFGSLDLAWKYSLIFGIALAVTIIAGFIKLYFDKRKVNNFAKKQAADAAEERDNDVVELNQREKDEGDLFGIRALEAGFYAGIPQSRPVSRASSFVGTPSMTSNTLVGSLASPNGQNHSAASSATTLPLAHLSNRDTTRDSENIAGSNTPRRLSPPVLKLQPSEAELSGRINHNTTVNMDLTVPPSPVVGQHPTSPTINVKDYDDMASQPRSPLGYQPDHYVPSAAPQIPLPTNLRASVISAESQSASFHNPTPEASPRPTLPSSPPETKEPSRGRSDSRSEPQSYFPSYADRSLPDPKAEKTGSNPSTDPCRR
ncbi:hypothetical protein GQ43DRAFT_260277 [Delitschia confertaspora ATCC 74209]|uniref:Uncharacterized protein n=1 Tax=Delitschia confertaspora ATCC 74209 TaxID=1513339 RepID=A0A9P4JQV6_9PLEO|nr:hypothetical protein GQ43DRAFT_260277 [Delitschia confertaspora ATCC 74209]